MQENQGLGGGQWYRRTFSSRISFFNASISFCFGSSALASPLPSANTSSCTPSDVFTSPSAVVDEYHLETDLQEATGSAIRGGWYRLLTNAAVLRDLRARETPLNCHIVGSVIDSTGVAPWKPQEMSFAHDRKLFRHLAQALTSSGIT